MRESLLRSLLNLFYCLYIYLGECYTFSLCIKSRLFHCSCRRRFNNQKEPWSYKIDSRLLLLHCSLFQTGSLPGKLHASLLDVSLHFCSDSPGHFTKRIFFCMNSNLLFPLHSLFTTGEPFATLYFLMT